jgi:glutathione S-transferase
MGLAYELERVPYPVPDAYRARNPMGSVPFLEDGDVAMSESVAMMLYVAQKYGPTPLLPEKRLAEVLMLTVFSETSIGGALNTLMAAHFGAPEADKRNWSVRGVEAHVEKAIDYVESLLGDRAFLAGDELTLADIAVTTALGMWKGALGKSISARLTAYRERLAARPAYQRANEKNRA